jgi:hypothetical protein
MEDAHGNIAEKLLHDRLGIDARHISEGELDSDLPEETHYINVLSICDSEGSIHFW